MTAPAPSTPPASADELFAEIHRDHLGIIIKVTHGFVASPADRDDLFQEILIALWQALPKFSAQARLSTYVYRVALSCALNWKRSQQRYGRKLDDYTLALPALTAAPGPEQERLRWLYDCIHQLPPVDRTLILLSLDRLGSGLPRRRRAPPAPPPCARGGRRGDARSLRRQIAGGRRKRDA